MAGRDYKNGRDGGRSGGKKRGSTMLVGIVIGVLVGLAAALGVALYINKAPSPFVDRKPGESAREETPPPKPAPKAEKIVKQPDTPPASSKDGKDGKDSGKPRFEFYGILQGKEEAVKEKDMKPAAPKDVYYLQAGAFQSAADADNLKAKLALAGIEATIQTALLPDNKTWHRVRLGPFTSVEDVGKAKARLKENQIEGQLIKVKDAAPKT
ncbi:MAG: SPOR domain-containing protein [Burkholderiales bacterium]|nr:SPOR domain-containing protein [Burkholderiales bacterium]